MGGRLSQAQYQYASQSANLDDFNRWAPCWSTSCSRSRNSGRQQRPADPRPANERGRRPRRGRAPGRSPRRSTTRSMTPSASGRSRPCTQRYNQHHVILEVDPDYLPEPGVARQDLCRGPPPASWCRWPRRPISNRQHLPIGQSPGPVSRRDAVLQSRARHLPGPGDGADREAAQELNMPASVQGSFQGTAQMFQASLANSRFLSPPRCSRFISCWACSTKA